MLRLFQRVPMVRLARRDPWHLRTRMFVAHAVWGLRVELTIALTVWTVYLLLLATVGRSWAVTGLLIGLAVVATTRTLREELDELLRRASLRRRWERGCRHAGLTTLNDRVPAIAASRPVPAGELLTVRMPAGTAVPDLEAKAETVASFLRLRELRVLRLDEDASQAAVTLVKFDPLAGTVPLPWPLLNAARTSLWEPFPVGVDEDGDPVGMSLVERNLLLGGEPGGGKSVCLSMPLAVAALDPDVDLYLADGKQVELAPWRPLARAFVGPNLSDAIDVLRALQRDMDGRYELLKDTRRRKVEPDTGLRLAVVACDELAYYLTIGDRNGTREFANLLRDLVSRGRAAGIITLSATQKPSGDIVPTALRDLHGFRWALRCSTKDASDTILGAGWATAGYSAASIAGDSRGVGWLLAEGDVPVRLRSYYLSDDDLWALAARAQALRDDQADDEDGPGLAVVA